MKVRELLHALAVADPELEVVVTMERLPRSTYLSARYAGVDELNIATIERTLRGEFFVVEAAPHRYQLTKEKS